MTAIRAAALCLALLPLAAHAAPYSSFTVFGDSLSDRGNLAETGIVQKSVGGPTAPVTNFPNPPSNHDSFTNGPVAVQLLAQSLGFNADPSLFVTGFKDVNNLFGGLSYVPGGNYAVAGATSSGAPIQGGVPGANLTQQVAAYLAATSGAADPNGLYTVMAGGNDVRNAAHGSNGAPGAGQPEVDQGVASELAAIAALTAAGARNLLVVNVPDVGAIPESKALGAPVAAAATAYSLSYDSELANGLAAQAEPAGTRMTQFDLLSYNAEIIANLSSFGITDGTDPCFVATPVSPAATAACGGTGGPNIGTFEYWDSIHPTSTIHALWASGMEQALAGVAAPSPFDVPEPASAAAFGVGLLGLAAIFTGRRRRGAAHRL